MIRLSAVIITYNEEKNIARCIASLQGVADEIIVADSFSTDQTATIATSMGARVAQHAFAGYAAQKNHATTLASSDWILSLDADEELTEELKKSILAIKKSPSHLVYKMPRITNYCGQWIRYAGWYPDHQTRLYNRTAGSWQELRVHEYWKANEPGTKMGLLQGDIRHYSFASISEHLRKIDRYTELAAQAAIEKGKTASIAKIVFSPFWHFVTEYFFKLGFLEGFHGLVICRLSAYTAFAKYSKIRMYSRSK